MIKDATTKSFIVVQFNYVIMCKCLFSFKNKKWFPGCHIKVNVKFTFFKVPGCPK